jgi:hypothetical protein
VITVSGGIASKLEGDFSDLPPVSVVRNIPQGVAPREVAGSGFRERIGVLPTENLAVFAGSVVLGSRGLETVLDALARVSNWRFAVVGDGPALQALRERAEQLGIADRVHFEGFVPQQELLVLTSQADVGFCLIQNVNMSYYLSLPNKLFEYLYAGIGVIGSDLPEISAFIHKHGIGSVVDPDSASSVASALSEWKAPPQACLEAAQSDADWEREKVRLLSIYDRCLGPGRGSWETPPARPRWPEEASGWALLTSGLPPALESAAQHAFEKVVTIPGVEELQAWLGSAERARIPVLDEALIESTRSGHALRLAWASRGLELLAGDPIRCRTRPFGWAERSHRRLRAHHWKRARRRELERLVSRSGSPEPQGRRGIGGGGLP